MKAGKTMAVCLTAALLTASMALSVSALPGNNKTAEDGTYLLMNIPYREFYQAELNNDTPVDAYTSATKAKVRTGTLAGGSYHVDDSGDRIDGVTFPVKVTGDVDLSALTQVTDQDALSITVTNRGKEVTADYSGSQVLFERPDYAYYVLDEAPSFYKELRQNEDGSFSFGKTQGDVTEVQAQASFTRASNYGDYQLNLESEELQNVGTVYGVIVSTKEGNDYGLRHMENIWRNTNLAWCTGYTTTVHGCPTSSEHYASMAGQTITEVTYFTDEGIKKVSLPDIYVDPVKYALMNIPYADFYQNEVNVSNPRAGIEISNDVPVDIYTSATKSKTLNAGLAGGSYHVNSDGSDITGVIYPVKLGDIDLSNYRQVTDADRVEITTSGRGGTTTTTYEGKDALFESDSYSYYILNEAPLFYKTVNVDENGQPVFTADNTAETLVEGAEAELLTETRYGDYQLNVSGPEANTVYGVVLYTNEGNAYGLRDLENIWRVNNLAWCTGFTNEVHGCRTSSAHYEKIMGQTINKITYFTDEGKKSVAADIYVPIKTGALLTADNAAVSDGVTFFSVSGLGEGFEPVYTVTKDDQPTEFTAENGQITFDAASVENGAYVLTATDKTGVYAPVSASFELTIPAVGMFNGKLLSDAPALIAAEGVSEAQFADYLSAISTVTVNETAYSAVGHHGAVVLIDPQTGLIAADNADVFSEDTDTFTVTVKASGYDDLAFTLSRTASAEPSESSEEPSTEPSESSEEPSTEPSESSEEPSAEPSADTSDTSAPTASEPSQQTQTSVVVPDGKAPNTSDTTAAALLAALMVSALATAIALKKKESGR